MVFFQGKKEPTEMDRVMENLTNAEAELQGKIFLLGQLYYSEHKGRTDVEPQYRNLLDLIGKLDENRKGFYQNKLRLEGKMMCANCGEIIPYGSMYCSVCGKKANEKQEELKDDTEAVSEDSTSKCPSCGHVVEKDSIFCVSCGYKLDQ